jgi:Flp pilus assembly protein TadB
MRQQVLLLTSVLNRWCHVKSDLLFALEQSLQADLDSDLKTAIRHMLIRIRGGMQIDTALIQFGRYSSHEHFRDLITAIRLNFKHRGNLPLLLESMEWQFFKLEEAYQQRRITNNSEFRTSVIFILLIPLIIAAKFLLSSDLLIEIFFSGTGYLAGIVSIACYLLAVAAIWRIRQKMTL